jgi:hypothetical protein
LARTTARVSGSGVCSRSARWSVARISGMREPCASAGGKSGFSASLRKCSASGRRWGLRRNVWPGSARALRPELSLPARGDRHLRPRARCWWKVAVTRGGTEVSVPGRSAQARGEIGVWDRSPSECLNEKAKNGAQAKTVPGPLALAGLRPASLAAPNAHPKTRRQRIRSRAPGAGVRQNDGQSERFRRVLAFGPVERGPNFGNAGAFASARGKSRLGTARSRNA